MRSGWRICFGCVAGVALPLAAAAQDAEPQDSNLAQQLSNPVAALISVPFQFNYDAEIGPDRDGSRVLLNVQPVIPLSISPDWNLISRTILPVVWQDEVFPGAGEQAGLGDTVQSLFFSPASPGPSGIIWGVGPVLLLPTGTDDLLSSKKWGAGPTAVVLKQSGGWTFGGLVNHIWSFAGDDSRADVNATFMQPFVTYTTPNAWTFNLNTETAYDWTNKTWAVPINVGAAKLLTIGKQPVSIGANLRYWAESPDSGPHGFGGRLNVTFLFPKGK